MEGIIIKFDMRMNEEEMKVMTISREKQLDKVNEFMYLEVVKKMKNKYIETKAYSSQYIELY